MEATAQTIDQKIDETTVLETVLAQPDSTLVEIANKAKLLPPLTYEIVSGLRMKDLLSIKEDEAGTRRYSITDAGRQAIGITPDQEPSAEDEQAAREEEAAERSHGRALKVIEPLAEFPHALKEPEQRELVLKAIGEKYGTLDGIKRRVGFPAWFDATELLAGMSVDYLIRKETKGDLTAYFLYNDKPVKFWRIGDGRIDFDRDPSFFVRNEPAKAEELSNKSQILYPEKKRAGHSSADIDADLDTDDFDPDADEDLAPIGKPADAFNSKVIAQNGASAEEKKKAQPRGAYQLAGKKRAGRYNYREFTAAEIEQAAAASTTWAETCEALKSSSSGLHKKLSGDPKLKAAYKRGIAMRTGPANAAPGKKNGRPMKDGNRIVKQPKRPANGKSPDLDVDEVERLASEGKTAKEAAEHFGLTVFVFKNRLNAKKGPNKGIRDAWYRGKKASTSTPAKRTYKTRDISGPITTKFAAGTVEEPTVTEDKSSDKQDVVIRQALNVDLADSESFHAIAENFSFNVGNALIHINLGELDAAISYLQREQLRRERQAQA